MANLFQATANPTELRDYGNFTFTKNWIHMISLWVILVGLATIGAIVFAFAAFIVYSYMQKGNGKSNKVVKPPRF